VNAFRGGSMVLRRAEPQPDMDPPDHQNSLIRFDFAFRFRAEPPIRGGNLTRLQRASKGAAQSTRGAGDDVVERGCTRRVSIRRHPVVLGDGAVDPEGHRLRLGREKRVAHWPAEAFNPHA